jgi:molybdate transport system substrate-binding protein
MSPRHARPLNLEYALLGLLIEQPMHGYELYRRLLAPDALGEVWPLKRAQCYALLAKLEQAGYLQRETTVDSYPPRQLLRLTPAGRTVFSDWMQQPVPVDADMQPNLLARLFFARRAGAAQRRTFLEQQYAAGKHQRIELQQMLAARPDPADFGAVALRWRLHQIDACLHWIETQRSWSNEGVNEGAAISYSIATLQDSPQGLLARRFVAAVCAPVGQAVLHEYGFLAGEAPTETGEAALPPAEPGTLIVYAAASLTHAFREIGRRFEAEHPGTRIEFQFAGSHRLARQLMQGGAADVFAAAHPQAMEHLITAGRIAAGTARICAANRLALATSRNRPAQLLSLADLAQPGRRLAFGSAATAIGHYALALLDRGEQRGELDSQGRLAVLQNVVSYAETPGAVLEQVIAGIADVGIVFASDCKHVADRISLPLLYSATGTLHRFS